MDKIFGLQCVKNKGGFEFIQRIHNHSWEILIIPETEQSLNWQVTSLNVPERIENATSEGYLLYIL